MEDKDKLVTLEDLKVAYDDNGNKISDLKSAIDAIESLSVQTINFGWLQSTDIYTNDGYDRDNRPTRSRSGYILVPKNASLTIKPSPWYIQYHKYNATTGQWIEMSSFTGAWTNAEFVIKNTDSDYLYRFVVRDADSNANVTASNITVIGSMLFPIVKQVTENTEALESLDGIPDDVTRIDATLDSMNNMEPSAISFGWLQSTDIYPTDGSDRDDRPTRARSGYIELKKGAILTVDPKSYYMQWFRYKEDGTWDGMSNFTASWTNRKFSLQYTDNDYKFRFVVRDADSNANVTAENVDSTAAMDYPIVGMVLKNVEDIESLKENEQKFEFVLPRFLHICGGIEQNIYFQNVIRKYKASQAYEIKATTFATNYNDLARISPAENTTQSHGFRFYAYLNNSESHIESSVLDYTVVPKTSGSGLNKKVMLIGDSLTFNTPMSKHLVDDLLSGDTMSVQLIGTLGDAPYKREGRSGWGYYNYLHEASHTNESGTTFTNAFWNPSTSKFDFSYYMNQNSFSGVDYVFINLGTNDFGRNTEDIITDLDEMLTSIRAYNSNVRIGIWTPPPRSLTGNGSMVNHDTLMGIVKAIIQAHQWDENSGIKNYIVPVTLNVDPFHDFPMEEVDVSRRNSNYKMLVTTDKVHPSDAGYFKMADMIYSYIKYFGSLDAT